MTVTVVDTWPWHCVLCQVALHLSRSITAGACCCCRGDHAPDERVDIAGPNATTFPRAVGA